MDGYVAVNGGGDGHTLRTPQLEHRLHVLAEEGGLDGHLVGQVALYDAGHTLEDVPQPEVGVVHLPEVYHPHGHHAHGLSRHAYHPVAHHIGAGVYAQYHALAHRSMKGFMRSSSPMVVSSP